MRKIRKGTQTVAEKKNASKAAGASSKSSKSSDKPDPAESDAATSGQASAPAGTPAKDEARDAQKKDTPKKTEDKAAETGAAKGSDAKPAQSGTTPAKPAGAATGAVAQGAAQGTTKSATSGAAQSDTSDKGKAGADTPRTGTPKTGTPETDKSKSDAAKPDAKPAETGPWRGDAPQTEHTKSEKPTQPASTVPVPQPDPVVVRRGGFWPVVLGGIVAGAIGFGAAWYYFEILHPAPDAQPLDAVEADLAALSDRVADLAQAPQAEAPDLSGLETAQSDLAARLGGLSGRIEDVQARLDRLEAQPQAGGGASDARVEALSQRLETQAGQIADLTETLEAREQAASAAAMASLRRAALTRVQTALDSGAAFRSALDDLEATGTDVPGDLRAVASEGVVTLSQLQSDFPDRARAALAAVRRSGDGAADGSGGGGGFMSFMSDQLGVRSLTPREGAGPDAVLSRAEAALAEGRLTDALAEIETLPDAARAELSPWVERARARLDAVHAAETLAAEPN